MTTVPVAALGAADVAQIASALFTAVAAGAAWWTVRHAGTQSATAREALDVQTQPLLTDVPRGQQRRPTWFDESGEPGSWEDAGDISVGLSGPEPVASVGVPLRNVGTGTARIRDVIFTVGGAQAPGRASNPVVPSGETTRAILAVADGDPAYGSAEEIAGAYEDFSVTVSYADVSGRLRGVVKLDVRNGQYPWVVGRSWTEITSAELARRGRRSGEATQHMG
jgi:hypothetical protein